MNFFATTTASALVGKLADRYGLLAGMHCAVIAQVVGGMGFFAVIHSIRRHGIASRLVSHRPENHGPPEPLFCCPTLEDASE